LENDGKMGNIVGFGSCSRFVKEYSVIEEYYGSICDVVIVGKGKENRSKFGK
jgi:hypothetical protein